MELLRWKLVEVTTHRGTRSSPSINVPRGMPSPFPRSFLRCFLSPQIRRFSLFFISNRSLATSPLVLTLRPAKSLRDLADPHSKGRPAPIPSTSPFFPAIYDPFVSRIYPELVYNQTHCRIKEPDFSLAPFDRPFSHRRGVRFQRAPVNFKRLQISGSTDSASASGRLHIYVEYSVRDLQFSLKKILHLEGITREGPLMKR